MRAEGLLISTVTLPCRVVSWRGAAWRAISPSNVCTVALQRAPYILNPKPRMFTESATRAPAAVIRRESPTHRRLPAAWILFSRCGAVSGPRLPLAWNPSTLNHPLLPSQASALQKATLAAGCFWGPELVFQRIPGVLATAVGYSQGFQPGVSYEQVCTGTTGHVEVVQVRPPGRRGHRDDRA